MSEEINKEKKESFLKELAELYKKHGMYVGACCCSEVFESKEAEEYVKYIG